VGGCLSGLTACAGVCRDTRTDEAHCGACDNACAAGRSCLAGACSACGAAGQPACGTSCNARLTVCSGVCRDLTADVANCGACGNACGASALCRAAACVPCGRAGQPTCAGACAARLTPCADTCRDLTADASHCGACGRACDAGAVCEAGACQARAQLFITYLSSFARLADGTFRAWGSNNAGQLGDGTTTQRLMPSTTRVVADTEEVVGGSQHSCARRADGSVQCWGSNAAGQLGDGSASTLTRATPAPVPGLTAVAALAAGPQHTCAVRGDGTVRCWGANANYQLGTGDARNRDTPTAVTGLTGSFVAVTAGTEHTCALRADGAVWCWGSNAMGQLGDGPATRTAPLQVPGLTATAVSAGGQNTCALLADGSVRCWGANRYGQVGDGSSTNRNAPVAVRTAAPAVELRVGATFACARLMTGVVQCWGYNGYGAVGDGTNNNRATPTNVVGVTGATELSGGGGGHTCARIAAGVRCWGYNTNGQCGDGGTTFRMTPVAVPGV
jgi:alpha-tubulin suppressor-like RCC1 family protein